MANQSDISQTQPQPDAALFIDDQSSMAKVPWKIDENTMARIMEVVFFRLPTQFFIGVMDLLGPKKGPCNAREEK